MTPDDKILPNLIEQFCCGKCNFNTCRKSLFNTHLLTAKHKKMIMNDKILQNLTSHVCICGKIYKYRQGLHKHSKNCNQKSLEKPLENNLTTNNAADNKDIILELLKQNNEFKQMIIELKAIANLNNSDSIIQIKNYMKQQNITDGLIINFGQSNKNSTGSVSIKYINRIPTLWNLK